ncbi:LOW QUALITY PROTEIN: trypsin alpha-3-like [Carassius carassius]|uniref:LOW QUALITY PROTEIN: trypsin alpha-3-like n=1 Tax=Carassius carassius TaxID=217509 RepID=UPI0028693C72|nr:LOW QUALITY PROTEIN: trypsin alpha-3-like [Carassius carassius]
MNRLIFASLLLHGASQTVRWLSDLQTAGDECSTLLSGWVCNTSTLVSCPTALQCKVEVISAANISPFQFLHSQKKKGTKSVTGPHMNINTHTHTHTHTHTYIYIYIYIYIYMYKTVVAAVVFDSWISVVSPVKFQREGGFDPEEAADVKTVGWGSLNNLGGRPDKLQELTIKVMERWLCGRGDYYGTKFTNNMLCAAERRKDTCDGDSGGPLLYKDIAVGITSNGGKKCGFIKKHGVTVHVLLFSTLIKHFLRLP